MVIPINISIELWAAKLIEDFPYDNIPVLKSNEEWKSWGNTVIQENSFATNAAPGTDKYQDPNDWMMAVYSSMLNF
jgi:hypothetical protein